MKASSKPESSKKASQNTAQITTYLQKRPAPASADSESDDSNPSKLARTTGNITSHFDFVALATLPNDIFSTSMAFKPADFEIDSEASATPDNDMPPISNDISSRPGDFELSEFEIDDKQPTSISTYPKLAAGEQVTSFTSADQYELDKDVLRLLGSLPLPSRGWGVAASPAQKNAQARIRTFLTSFFDRYDTPEYRLAVSDSVGIDLV